MVGLGISEPSGRRRLTTRNWRQTRQAEMSSLVADIVDSRAWPFPIPGKSEPWWDDENMWVFLLNPIEKFDFTLPKAKHNV